MAVLSFEGDAAGQEAYAEVGVDVLSGLTGESVRRGRARSLAGPYAFDPAMAKAVARYAPEFDVVVLSGQRMLQYASEAAAGRSVVADLVDDPVLEYSRRGTQGLGFRDWARRCKNRFGRPRYERRFLRHVDATTFVSEADCESFSDRHPAANVVCVPNGVDIEYFRRPEQDRPSGTSNPRIVFTGHMGNPNNERAATFLVREVAPLIWKSQPDAVFQVVGAEPTEAVCSLAAERVEVTGRVEDIRPYLWEATVVMLPMQSGTGIKNKLLEAWAARAAVVATPISCQGVPAENGQNLLLGQGARELAARALRLLSCEETRIRLAVQGRRTVEERMTWTVAANRLRATISDPT